MNDDSVVYFNNCRNRDHVAHYGDGAFYDLGTTGLQASKANDLPVGQDCVVATTEVKATKEIRFTWFTLTAEKPLQDLDGNLNRVFLATCSTVKFLPNLAPLNQNAMEPSLRILENSSDNQLRSGVWKPCEKPR